MTEGETKEFSFMYPRMIRDAQDENRQDAVSSFTLALEREKHHLEVFTRALEQLEKLKLRLITRQINSTKNPETKPDPKIAVKDNSDSPEVPLLRLKPTYPLLEK
ncbi:MAG: hypothetical protein CM1200mP35_02130 [Chloroflexota bacterium]|nr:MAG: hypothetical protein CM1200mP35_02130 [Chloroflexota bacterium]